MEEVKREVKTGTGAEEKISTVTVNQPVNLKEALKEYGEEKLVILANRMSLTDRLNAERVALKGGEAKIKRKKVKDLAAKLIDDPDLMERLAEEMDIEL